MKRLPEYGEIKYDHRGYPICHICGKSFKKLLTHVWQKHGISAYDYKKEFGLDTTKGIICQETKEKLQESVKRNYSLVVENNLIKGGKRTRFEKGCEGRTRDKLSEQTKKELILRTRRMRFKKKEVV